MSTPQSAIIPDHCKAGTFIEADAVTGKETQLKQACIKSLTELQNLQNQFPNKNLDLTIAFGNDLWRSVGHDNEGQDVKPFRPLGNGLAPATQHDVMIHIDFLISH